MIKILSFAIVLVGFHSIAYAQKSVADCFGGKNTLLGRYGLLMHPDTYKENPWNIYTEGALSVNSLGDQRSPSGFQLGAGAVYMDKYSAGILYGQNFGRFTSSASDTQNLEYRLQYMGGEAQFTLFPRSLISLSFPMQLAIGSLAQYTVEGETVVDKNSNDRLGLIIPGIKAEVNVTNRLKFGVGANYRITVLADQLPSDQLDGVNVQFLLRYNLLR